ncbi:ATP-binding cassette domain-containing protein [Vagococcus carniphilus]|uniref:ATP-binding cassette domain-containing protein n=1 Tax=Vagococcus carniphilus TaxID=218144 RepID=UPI003BA991CC
MKKIILIHWKDNLCVLFFISLVSISSIVSTLMLSSILDALIKFDWNQFLNYTFLLIVANIFLLFFLYFQIKYINKTIQKMSNYLRYQIINRIAKMSPLEFKKQTIGSYTSRLINDTNQIEQIAFEKFYELFAGVITLIFSLVTLFLIHWSLFLLVLVESIFLIQLPRLLNKKLKKATLSVTSQNEVCTSTTTQLLSGYSTFYNFKNSSYFVEKIKKEFLILANKKNSQYHLVALVAVLGGVSNIVGQITAFSMSGYLAFRQIIPIGIIWTVSNLSAKIFNLVGSSSQNISSIQSVAPLFENINNFIFSVNDADHENYPIDKIGSGIILKNTGYSYDKKNFLFRNINYHFQPNGKYAVIGKSGSGKSTLLNILNNNLSDYEGSIVLNDIELNTISKDSVLDFILYIDQNPYILEGSIRENIVLGDCFDDEEIKEVLKQVQLSQFANNLDFSLKESGNNVSGGQRQRIALARGLIRNKKIILLDESTSSLDKETAYEIENLILSMDDITVIMVNHNLTPLIKEKLDGILNLSE